MRQRVIAKGVQVHRVSLLPNWVDLQTIYPLNPIQVDNNPYREELQISEEKIILMYSGSMNKKQGLDLLVEVIKTLAHLPNLIWLLAGEGPTKAELVRDTVGLINVIHLPLQPEERMNDWLNLADIHLLPQKANAADLVLPSKLLGILASGRPLVASTPVSSELGWLAEQAGIRVEPGDSEGFSQAIGELVNNRDKRRRLGANGRRLAQEKFGRDAVLLQLEIDLMGK